MDTIISLEPLFPGDVAKGLAARIRARRLELNLTQEGLAKRAGLKLPTYRKFERQGVISLDGLLHIAFALDSLHEFEALFTQEKYETIDDVLRAGSARQRRRGRKK